MLDLYDVGDQQRTQYRAKRWNAPRYSPRPAAPAARRA
ncbi:MAG: hypothetical protein R3D80_20905 [Paracoccaceae bacterium]